MKITLLKLNRILIRSDQFPPSKAILPVLAGFSSYNPDIRKKAREALFSLKDRISNDLASAQTPEQYRAALKESALFAARMFNETRFNPNITENDVGIFFTTLMGAGRTGRFYAFLIWQGRFTAKPYLKSQAEFLPDELKLAFVDEYLNAGIAKRRIHARFFKSLLGQVRSRPAVIHYHADLLTQGLPADPFLCHLHPDLIDPDLLRQNELNSLDPAVRSKAVLALAMMSPSPLPPLMKQLLENDPAREVRAAVLKVLNRARPGEYAPLIPSLLKQLYTAADNDALAAFDALVLTVSDKVLPVKIIGTLKEKRPDLLPKILEGVTRISDTAFIMAQDLAFRRDLSQSSEKAIFYALARGLVQRHPEAVLKGLSSLGPAPFLKTLKTETVKTRMAFQSFAASAAKRIKALEKSAPFLKTSLSILISSRDDAINKKDGLGRAVCKKMLFNALDLSETITEACRFCLDDTAVVACDLSGMRTRESSFKRAIFWDSNLAGSNFLQADFTGAVFVRTRFLNTEFKGCCFHGAAFLDCDFSHAVLSDSFFTGARISNTVFTAADFSRVSLSGVDFFRAGFEQARFRETDFSGSRAVNSRITFCPDPDVRAHFGDFNSDFLFGFKRRLPEFNGRQAGRILDLICAQFMETGRHRFFLKNRNALLCACDVFPAKTYDIFELIPLLLHTSLDFPGFTAARHGAPHGIRGYVPSERALAAAAKYLPPGVKKWSHATETCRIQGLFTIGSTGTIAQNIASDIDYWVCIDARRFSKDMKGALEKKLQKIEAWALDIFKTEVHFFALDVRQVRQNTFGTTGRDNSGSAQALILKDEFYRTMIHVAGRQPMWTALPAKICRHGYDRIGEALSFLPFADTYLDLGDIHVIPEKEYYGALIWQIFKGLKSAFKSVIKMALVEKYYAGANRTPLLSNRFKDQWMTRQTGPGIPGHDPYYELLETLVAYYQKAGDLQSADLIRLCFVLQLSNLNPSRPGQTVFGIKPHRIHHMMGSGNWQDETVFKLGDLKTWHFSNIIRISEILKNHFLKKYRKLGRALAESAGEPNLMSANDKTVLENRMHVQFSRQPGKVENLLLVVKNTRYFQELILKYDKKHGTWKLVHRSGRIGKKQEETLKTSRLIEEIAAWMVNNRLYDETTFIQMAPNPTHVTSDDIRRLFETMHRLFTPYGRDRAALEALLSAPDPVQIMVSMNLYSPRNRTTINNAVAVHINTWGEMFCHPWSNPNGFSSLSALKTHLENRLGFFNRFRGEPVYFMPKRFHLSAFK